MQLIKKQESVLYLGKKQHYKGSVSRVEDKGITIEK